MAKLRAFIRVGKTNKGYKIAAATKDNGEPIVVPLGYRGEKSILPTVSFAVDLVIPDELFARASKVIGEINLSLEEVKIAATIPRAAGIEAAK